MSKLESGREDGLVQCSVSGSREYTGHAYSERRWIRLTTILSRAGLEYAELWSGI